jgi:hypothetical protein
VHDAWWCSTTFQHYSSRILGQHVPCPMDRSRRTYCVAPTLAWFKSSWFSSLGTLKNSSLRHSSKWHSNSSTTSWRWLSDKSQHNRNFWTCSAVHNKTCSVLRRSTRTTFGTSSSVALQPRIGPWPSFPSWWLGMYDVGLSAPQSAWF